MNLVLGHDEDVAAFASQKLGIKFVPPFVAFGIVDGGGNLCGAMIFNQYNHHSMDLSFYGRGCLTRRIIKAMFDYPFLQADVLTLRAKTRRNNKLTCKLLPRLGFVYEGTFKNYFGPERGDDAICYALTRKAAAKWIGE